MGRLRHPFYLMTLLCARLLTQWPANTGGIRGTGWQRGAYLYWRRDRTDLGLILYLLGLIFMVMPCFHRQISVQKNRIRILSRPDMYCTRAITTRSWFETALNYEPQILDSEIKEFPCLVHKLSAIPTALKYKPQRKMG